MRNVVGQIATVLAVASCSTGQHAADPGSVERPLSFRSGVDMRYRDDSVRPQDDLYRYLNGKWLDTFEIPADKGTYGAFTYVDDQTQEQLRIIVTGLAAADAAGPAEVGAAGTPGAARNAADAADDARKITNLYASFMDEARLETLGLAPLQSAFAEIDSVSDKRDIPALIARFNRSSAGAPIDLGINPDQKDSTRYAVSIGQSGLGLPDRDYYLKDDAKLKDARTKYLAHVEKMLRMAGDGNAKQSAADILKLETSMARLQWTRVENRDPEKTYNKFAVSELGTLMPNYGWDRYLERCGVLGKTDYVIIRQPSYFSGLDRLIEETPLGTWKSYFKWHQLSAAAPYLSKEFVDERFAFTGTALRGVPQNLPRWKRGLKLVDESMGEAIGRLYVARYFPKQNKARMETLVRNLIQVYGREVTTLDWMSEQTKRGAHEKLAKLSIKIGYPNTWRRLRRFGHPARRPVGQCSARR